MRLNFRRSLLAIGLASLLGAGAVSAGTLVEFPNLSGHTPANLSGYLARPHAGLAAELDGDSPSNGGGPFPAVVVLHGCVGITGHFTGIGDRLSSWGYVALAVDSLGPRGIWPRGPSMAVRSASCRDACGHRPAPAIPDHHRCPAPVRCSIGRLRLRRPPRSSRRRCRCR